MCAFVQFFTGMNAHMSGQIGFLCCGIGATFMCAFIRFFMGMNAHMSGQICVVFCNVGTMSAGMKSLVRCRF